MVTQLPVWISHGQTESGDALPMVAWHNKPDREALIEHYRGLVPEEFDCFGDDFMAGCIEVTPVTDWGTA